MLDNKISKTHEEVHSTVMSWELVVVSEYSTFLVLNFQSPKSIESGLHKGCPSVRFTFDGHISSSKMLQRHAVPFRSQNR